MPIESTNLVDTPTIDSHENQWKENVETFSLSQTCDSPRVREHRRRSQVDLVRQQYEAGSELSPDKEQLSSGNRLETREEGGSMQRGGGLTASAERRSTYPMIDDPVQPGCASRVAPILGHSQAPSEDPTSARLRTRFSAEFFGLSGPSPTYSAGGNTYLEGGLFRSDVDASATLSCSRRPSGLSPVSPATSPRGTEEHQSSTITTCGFNVEAAPSMRSSSDNSSGIALYMVGGSEPSTFPIEEYTYIRAYWIGVGVGVHASILGKILRK